MIAYLSIPILMMIRWYADMMIWWYDDIMIWWYNDKMIWWYAWDNTKLTDSNVFDQCLSTFGHSLPVAFHTQMWTTLFVLAVRALIPSIYIHCHTNHCMGWVQQWPSMYNESITNRHNMWFQRKNVHVQHLFLEINLCDSKYVVIIL